MGLKLKRNKRRNWLLSIIYKINASMFFLTSGKKLRLYLDLAWIFSRLAHEQIHKASVWPDDKGDFLIANLEKGHSILDIGCGKGHVIEKVIEKSLRITAIDHDSNAIEIVTQKFSKQKVNAIHGDASKYLDKNKESFDVTILSHVLEHIEFPEKLLEKVYQYTKFIYVEVPDFECHHLNLFRPLVNTDLVYTDADHVSEFDRDEMKDLLSSAGFEIKNEEYRYGVMKFWCQAIDK